MARPLRIEFEGAIYHVMARGNERKKIYFSKTDYAKFIQYLKQAKKKYNIFFHCYVLMSNHYHLIIETPDANLSRAMHYINGSYTTYVNIKKKRSGHLFQGRYKSIIVDKDNYLLELSRYIHLNPVRASIVQNPEEYPYSSYPAYISKKQDSIISDDLILGLLSRGNGNKRKEYQRFVEGAIGAEPDNPMKDVYGGIILGGIRFIKETLQTMKEDYQLKDEVSRRNELRATYEMEEVIEVVSTFFNFPMAAITGAKTSEKRNITVYLIKERTSTTNREIGEKFGGLTHSAVAKIYRRIKKEAEKDSKLRQKIGQIEECLDNFKG